MHHKLASDGNCIVTKLKTSLCFHEESQAQDDLIELHIAVDCTTVYTHTHVSELTATKHLEGKM